MESIIIMPRSKEEHDMLMDLVGKHNLQTLVLSPEVIEDLGLSMILKEVDREKTVPREEIMRKLEHEN